MSTIPPIATSPLQSGGLPIGGAKGRAESAGGFSDLLRSSLEQVNSMHVKADQAVEAMFLGEEVNPAEVLTAVQEAHLAFQLTMQMRNKALEVYREIKDIRI